MTSRAELYRATRVYYTLRGFATRRRYSAVRTQERNVLYSTAMLVNANHTRHQIKYTRLRDEKTLRAKERLRIIRELYTRL